MKNTGKTANVASFTRKPTLIPRDQHTISRQHISKAALSVLYRLKNAGYQSCLVGGCVRDLLLGIRPKDFDVATDAHPEQIRELFRNCRLIGRRFRLAHVRFGREIIEVSTFRANIGDSNIESNDDGRILRDNVYGTMDEDVWRRDFTVNALFYNIEDFSITDYVGGLQDIEERQMRVIGDPEQRYREDPVRMLRAVRLAAKLDMRIHNPAAVAIKQYGELLTQIPSARLFEEFQKLFLYGHGEQSMERLCQYQLLQYLMPAAMAGIGDPLANKLLQATLRDTDQRWHHDQPASPGFLIAAMLWLPFSRQLEQYLAHGLAEAEAIDMASDAVLSHQARTLAIPHRHTAMVRDIWMLQEKFQGTQHRRRQRFMEHKSLPAAVDFLALREQSGEVTGIDSEELDTFAMQVRQKRHTGSRRRGHNR
ncbi:MAG: polynucleotide adenylyltransferase PcnB [Candidatus Porifericomitaceae bacterium WSBS_2022_MAG_OTU9]